MILIYNVIYINNQLQVEGIFTAVKDVIEQQLGSDNYNLQATSNVTKNFLRQLRDSDVIIGYPDWLSNAALVSRFYGPPVREIKFAEKTHSHISYKPAELVLFAFFSSGLVKCTTSTKLN